MSKSESEFAGARWGRGGRAESKSKTVVENQSGLIMKGEKDCLDTSKLSCWVCPQSRESPQSRSVPSPFSSGGASSSWTRRRAFR